MQIADLSEAAIAKIRQRSFDRLIEKHEGPEDWSVFLQYAAEFLEIDGQFVLLPVEPEDREKITVLRCIPSRDGNALTIFCETARILRHIVSNQTPIWHGFMKDLSPFAARFRAKNFLSRIFTMSGLS